MVFLALLLILVGLAAWRIKTKVEFPLSKQLGLLQWGAWAVRFVSILCHFYPVTGRQSTVGLF